MTRYPAQPPTPAKAYLVVLLKRVGPKWQVGVGQAATGVINADLREYRAAGAARDAAMALAEKRGLLVLRADD